MKRTGIVMLFAVSAACRQQPAHPVPPRSVPAPAVAAKDSARIPLSSVVNEKDPACYMSLKAEGIADTVRYKGKLYGFCSAACKREFLTRPDYYVK